MNYFNPLDEHRATQRRFMLAGANRCIRCRKYSFTDYAVCNKCAKRYSCKSDVLTGIKEYLKLVKHFKKMNGEIR